MPLLKSSSPYVLLGLSEVLMHDRMLSSAALTAALLRILGLFRAVRRRIFWFGMSYCYKNYFYGIASSIAYNYVKICSGVKWCRYATRSIVISIWIRAVFMRMLYFWVNWLLFGHFFIIGPARRSFCIPYIKTDIVL